MRIVVIIQRRCLTLCNATLSSINKDCQVILNQKMKKLVKIFAKSIEINQKYIFSSSFLEINNFTNHFESLFHNKTLLEVILVIFGKSNLKTLNLDHRHYFVL